jgi:SAM-dependent methyltransferase
MDQAGRMTWEEAVLSLRARSDAKRLVEACFYDDPLLEAAERYANSTEWMAVRRLMTQHSGRAVDIGAGRGISAYALAKDGWMVTALEPDPSPVVGAGAIRALSTESKLQINVVEQWGERLPFDDQSFDLVHGRQVLHHANDLRQLCAEMARVLKYGGRFIATREHVVSRRRDVPAFLESHPLHHLYGGENAYLLSEYCSAIEDAGIKLTHVLNPKESDINLYPETQLEVKRRWARKLHLPFARLIPDAALKYAGARSDVPGRLYTFAGTKVLHA